MNKDFMIEITCANCGAKKILINTIDYPFIYKGRKFCCYKCMQEFKKRDKYRYYKGE